jgi:hypothetical protein
MSNSHKRWVSYELMWKRVKRNPYMITSDWYLPPSESLRTHSHFYYDWRLRRLVEEDRVARANERARWACIHERVLTLAMVLHDRLGEHSVWHDLPEAIVRMIACEAYLSWN